MSGCENCARASGRAAEARDWFLAALELDAENRQLRQWLTNILLVVAIRDELFELGRAEIDRRWPRPEGRA